VGFPGRLDRVGLRLRPAADRAGEPGVLPAMLETAVAAEAAGYGLVGVPERVDGSGGVPSALATCAALATSTRRVAIATAVLPLSLHHPLRVCEDVASIDGLAEGRFELGVGVGAELGASAGHGLAPTSRLLRFEEALILLREGFGPGPVAFAGEHFAVDGVEVHPKPWREGGPPIWVGSTAPALQRLAARYGCGLALEVGGDPRPYLDACAERGVAGRLALLGPAGPLASALEALPETGPSRLEVWIDADPEAAALPTPPAGVRL